MAINTSDTGRTGTIRRATVAPAATDKRAWRETAMLIVLALVAEISFLWGFVLPYALPQHYKEPLLDLAKINGAHPISANFFALTWVVSFFVFWLALSRVPNRPARSYIVVLAVSALVFNLTLLYMYPTGAADLLDYIIRARQLAHYGDNPWVHTPDEAKYAGDPMWAYIGGWANTTSPYGPMWELLAAGASLLAGADLWRNLILFKGLVILAYGAACWLVYAILMRVKPDWAARGLLFFAWNPLLLWETAGNGHNDMVMVAFMLLAFYFATFQDRRLMLAPVALALAALVKFVPIILLPCLLVLIWRGGGSGLKPAGGIEAAVSRVLFGAGAFLLTAIIVYAPFWVGPDTIGALWRQNLFTASIPTVARDFLRDQITLSEAQANWLVRNVALALTVLTVLVQSALLFFHKPDDEQGLEIRLYRACYTIFFVYLIFATLWFQPWYQIWLIGLAPIAAGRNYFSRTIAVNIGGVANYFVWDFLVIWNNSWDRVVHWTSALAVNLPPLLVTIFQLLGGQQEQPAQNTQTATLPVRRARNNVAPEIATATPTIRRSSSANERAHIDHSSNL